MSFYLIKLICTECLECCCCYYCCWQMALLHFVSDWLKQMHFVSNNKDGSNQWQLHILIHKLESFSVFKLNTFNLCYIRIEQQTGMKDGDKGVRDRIKSCKLYWSIWSEEVTLKWGGHQLGSCFDLMRSCWIIGSEFVNVKKIGSLFAKNAASRQTQQITSAFFSFCYVFLLVSIVGLYANFTS